MTKKSKLIKDYHLLSYDALDSTNEEAKRLAGGGATHGAFIWAKKQTDGKGRLGRTWFSPEGNLYVSVLLDPKCGFEKCSELSFVAAVAVAQSLSSILGDEKKISCKWPNDILCDGKKIAGILLESYSSISIEGDEKHWIVVGVGINIDSTPSESRFPPTSMSLEGVELISAKIVLSRFVYHFSNYYDDWKNEGFAKINKEWQENAYGIGKTVSIDVGGDICTGKFIGIAENGAMQIQTKDSIESINAGDASFPDLEKTS